MNLLYLGCHIIYCPNSKHLFKSWWESYYMYSVTKSTKSAVKDKSGYMFTLVMLIRTIFQGKWPLLQRGWRGCPSWWGGKTLILNGRPERWEQQSMILSPWPGCTICMQKAHTYTYEGLGHFCGPLQVKQLHGVCEQKSYHQLVSSQTHSTARKDCPVSHGKRVSLTRVYRANPILSPSCSSPKGLEGGWGYHAAT